MTEQELRDKLISVAPSAVYANESEIQAIVDLAKAYAEARQSKEIAELKAQVEGLKTDMQHSRLIEAAQVKESNELKAEIKRLRDGVKDQLKDIERMQRGGMKTSFLVFGGRLRRLLSPAPVTETQNEEQV